MRILIITQRWYPDTFGGSEHVASEQARRLAGRGHTVTVITERVRDILPYEIIEDGVRILRYGSEREFSRFGGASRTDLKQVRNTLQSTLKETGRSAGSRAAYGRRDSSPRRGGENGGRHGDYDIAILHHPFPAYGFFKAGLKIPALYFFHASTAREVEYEGVKRFPIFTSGLHIMPRLFARLFARWVLKIERSALLQSDKIAVLSDFSKAALLGVAPEVDERVCRIGIGIDQERFCPGDKIKARRALGLPADKNFILTVRRFSPRMGLSRLIYAMETVLERKSDVRLLIIGEGPLRQAQQKEIEIRKMQEKITLVGAVPISDLPLYYRAADVFALPTAAFEGLGMATLEALASGIPVVGTPAGATPELLNDLDPALITRGTKADDIADGLARFFERLQKERDALGKQARALAEKKYNWQDAVAELERVLSELRTK